MLRIILWSSTEQDKEESDKLAQLIARDINILPIVTSEKGALEEIRRLGESDRMTDSATLYMNMELALQPAEVLRAVTEAQTYSGDFAIFSIHGDAGSLCSPEIDAHTLVQSLSSAQSWNTGICVMRDNIAQEISEQSSLSVALLKAAIRTIGEEGRIDWSLGTIRANVSDITPFEVSLSNAQVAELLQYAVASVNVEELFPNHPWEEYPEESAAACYHALAARFIALGSLHNAQECLQFGDRLEDSPRSLALKGLIALQQGEVLAAVANMVSSLQEYEKRKTETPAHYLTFKPQNLEIINSSLQSGLSALNKRDNDRAAACFTDAVFQFDHFYQECGLKFPKVQ